MGIRRAARRRRRLHTLVFASAATVFAPQPAKSTKPILSGTTRPAPEREPDRDVPARVYEPAPAVDINMAFRLAPSAYDPLIEEAASRFHVDAALVRAIISDRVWVRSAGGLECGRAGPHAADAGPRRGTRRHQSLRSARKHHGGRAVLQRTARATTAAISRWRWRVTTRVPAPSSSTRACRRSARRNEYIARITSLIGLSEDHEP